MAKCKDCGCCQGVLERNVKFNTKLGIFLCKECGQKRENDV